MLSINDKLENGAVPDMILPFKMQKGEAQNIMENYVNRHKFFAPKQFKEEFNSENVMGVYFPYLDVDANTHATFEGSGEILVRRYTVKHGDSEETRYDADLYEIKRELDCGVDDLIVESSLKRMDGSKSETNNIINTILPFDTENCVDYDSNYLRGFTSERRDVNVGDMDNVVNAQIKDIVRHQANETAKQYDRGICWDKENVDIKGRLFKSMYLPVWLYSYFEQKTGMLHYVAVNARTSETMGSIPINKAKLLTVTMILEVLGAIIGVLCVLGLGFEHGVFGFLALLIGIFFHIAQVKRYRNADERHYHERETRALVRNVQKYDNLIKHEKRLSNARYSRENANRVEGVIIK